MRAVNYLAVSAAVLLGDPSLIVASGATNAQPRHEAIYSFEGGRDGEAPSLSGLTADDAGDLYGVTVSGGVPGGCGGDGCGTIFRLVPPAANGARWAKETLYSFSGGADGGDPYGKPLLDPLGNVYGTAGAYGASGSGTVWKLSPPAAPGGAWTQQILHAFGGFACGLDGREPHAGVLVGRNGHLFGTTAKGGAADDGTVFELSPPAPGRTTWTKQVLHSFGLTDGDFPSRELVASRGALFGTAAYGGPGGGIVFRLDPAESGAGPGPIPCCTPSPVPARAPRRLPA